MSGTFWQNIENKLRDMELDEDYDLFAVGYLIPQVALAENTWDKEEEPLSVFMQYVNDCIKQDKLSEQDTQLVLDIVQQL